jgi:hypothetical protein
MTTKMRINVRQGSSAIVFFNGGRNTDEVFQGSRKFKVETYYLQSVLEVQKKR